MERLYIDLFMVGWVEDEGGTFAMDLSKLSQCSNRLFFTGHFLLALMVSLLLLYWSQSFLDQWLYNQLFGVVILCGLYASGITLIWRVLRPWVITQSDTTL